MRAKYRSRIARPAQELATERPGNRSESRGPHQRQRHRQPVETRRALIEAAARIFNSAGYHSTDSNRIAREAGYAPGTFYVHFPDKLAIFLEVYESWVSAEWSSIEGYREIRRERARSTEAAEPRRAGASSQVADVSREPAGAKRDRLQGACGARRVARPADRDDDAAAPRAKYAGAEPGANARATADSGSTMRRGRRRRREAIGSQRGRDYPATR